MPREKKKRGRRAADAQKRKRDDEADNVTTFPKRRRTSADEQQNDLGQQENLVPLEQQQDDDDDDNEETTDAITTAPFYGLLSESEREYFKNADRMLEANSFADAEERLLFVRNVAREASGKELKLACTQACSRLLERLMLLADPSQLKSIFQKFAGHFLNLVQHRSASHCCETLFIRAAPVVTDESLADPQTKADSEDEVESSPAMQDLYLSAVEDLAGDLGYLMTDQFASHALRILLIVLSGKPLDASRSSVVSSKRKANVDIFRPEKHDVQFLESRTVPNAFMISLEKLINDMVLSLDAHYIRLLATHPIGNPILQLLLQLELTHFGKQRAKDESSLIRKMLPDDSLAEGTESHSFVNGLIYDPVGSRLLETVIEQAPGKLFKSMYRQIFKDRIGSLARNDISSYVVAKILERLSPEELDQAMHAIIPQIPSLASRSRTSIMRNLVERCGARQIETKPLADALQQAYADNEDTFSLANLLQLEEPNSSDAHSSGLLDESNPNAHNETQHAVRKSPQQVHASLLAQSMLRVPGPLSTLILDALTSLTSPQILHVCYTPQLSPILQTALTTSVSSLITRRKLIIRLYGHIATLSQSSSGSHVIDAVERGTLLGLAFVRERVAEELAENEAKLRDSPCGRKVWKNWRMDMYMRNSDAWVRDTRKKVGNDGFQSLPGMLDEGVGGGDHQTKLAMRKRNGSQGTADGGLGRIQESLRRKEMRIKPATQKAKMEERNEDQFGEVREAVSKALGRGPAVKQGQQNGKSPLQMARERYARSHPEKARH